MTPQVPLIFWTILVLGPIPLWHLQLHAALPFWKRRPRAFYAAAAGLWGLFLPLSIELASRSSPLFAPSDGMKLISLGAGLLACLVTLWSMVTLTPSRFFLWAVLRPEDSPPVLILRGPYRFAAHPTYLSMVVATASSFLASGETVLLGAFWSMVLLLALVIVLEQRELRARLRTSPAHPSPGTHPSSAPAFAPLALGTDESE